MRQIGFSYTQIFLLAASYEILVFLLEIPTGVFADRFGLKKCAVLGHFISAASCFPIALFPASYSVFLLWSVLSAICTTLNSGSVEALQFESLRDLSREAEYTKLRGRLAAIGGLSMPVGAFIGGALCENIGFGNVAALGGLTGLCIAAVFVSMREPVGVQLAREKSTSQNIFKGISENFRIIKNDKELTGVIIAGAVVFAAYLLINNYSQPCLEEVGIQSYRIAGLFSGTFMLALAAVSWWAGTFDATHRGERHISMTVGRANFEFSRVGKTQRHHAISTALSLQVGRGCCRACHLKPVASEKPAGKKRSAPFHT